MISEITFLGIGGRLLEFIRLNSPSALKKTPPAPGAAAVAFQSLALDLFTLQYEHVPPFRRLCEARQVRPSDIHRWQDLPCVPSAALKDFDFTSLPPSERTTVFHSSGTTQQRPGRHFHSPESLALYEASLLPWFCAHCLPDWVGSPHMGVRSRPAALQFLSLTPPAKLAPHSSLAYMIDAVFRHVGGVGSVFAGRVGSDGVWDLDVARIVGALDGAVRTGVPVFLLGTAFSFVRLLDACIDGGKSWLLPPGSRVFETGGYKGRSRSVARSELHALIGRALGIVPAFVVSEYGMSELSSQAYSNVAGNLGALGADGDGVARGVFAFPPWARSLVLSPETGGEVGEGETGLLRVIDLANVRSVIGIQTEDLAIRRGDGFELVGRMPYAELRGCSLLTSVSPAHESVCATLAAPQFS